MLLDSLDVGDGSQELVVLTPSLSNGCSVPSVWPTFDFLLLASRQRLRDEEGSETESGDGKSSLEARKRKTVFENVFEGSLSSTLMCAECQHESKVTEPFLDLSLALKSYPTSFVQRQRSPSESPVEKKKKTGPRSSQSKKNRLKRAEKTGSPGNCKRGRVSDHDEHDERNPTSLVHSQEHNGGSEVQTDDGGEVVSLFHTFDLSDEMQEPAREVMSSNGGEEYDMEDAMLFSLFDDVEDIPTPPSEDSQIAPVDDFELSPSRTLNSLGSKNEFMSLLESLASFLGPEILDGDDRPVCEECSKRASEVEPAKAPLPPPTATSPSELEKALESSSECSDNTVGAEKSDRSSSVGSGAEDARDESHDGGGKVTKVRTRSIKRYSIQSLPPVLVLQLNRFQQVSPYGGLRKLRGQCHFPPTLDLSDYFAKEGSTRYQLSGVVCHSGSLRGGHYTAYVNSEPKSDRWFYCSDANIQPANEDDVLKSEPYLLFYEQCR